MRKITVVSQKKLWSKKSFRGHEESEVGIVYTEGPGVATQLVKDGHFVNDTHK